MFYNLLTARILAAGIFALAIVCSDVAHSDDAASKLIDRGAKQLARGKYIDALESYSRAAGVDEENRQALEGVRRAKNEIRQQMGDVSAARLTDLMEQLERIDADRVGQLTARVAELEGERREAIDRVVALEADLNIALQQKDHNAIAASTTKAPSPSPESVKDNRHVANLEKKLETARSEYKDMTGKIADLNRQLKELEEDADKAASAAEDRIRKLIAKSERAEAEKQQAVKSARVAGEERTALRLENRDLAAKLDDLRNKPVPEASTEVKVVKDTTELDALRTALNELETQNRNLSAALSEVKTAPKTPASVLPRSGKSPDRSEEINELQTVVKSMESELRTLIGEKSDLKTEVNRLRRDLIATRAADPDRRLKGIERRTSEQGLQIRGLEESVARTQESCEALLAGINEREITTENSRESEGSTRDAMDALATLKKRLSGLEVSVAKLSVEPPPSQLPSALTEERDAGKPVIDTDKQELRKQYTELAAESDALRKDLAGAVGRAQSMQKKLSDDGDELEDRLDAMDKMHKNADRNIEKLKRQLRKIEERIGDAG